MKKAILAIFFFLVCFPSTISLAGQALPKYGVVYGSDTNIQDSEYEILRFKNNQELPQYNGKSVMFFRDNVFKSLLLFNTKLEARKAQEQVEAYLNKVDRQGIAKNNPNWVRGSYVVDLSRWCLNWSKNQKTQDKIKYHSCQSK